MTQDCIKDEEEEQDKSLHLLSYLEKDEEDNNLGDTIYGSKVEGNAQNTRSQISRVEGEKNGPDLKVTDKSSKNVEKWFIIKNYLKLLKSVFNLMTCNHCLCLLLIFDSTF